MNKYTHVLALFHKTKNKKLKIKPRLPPALVPRLIAVKTKQNKTKQNKTKQNKTKQNKTKQNKTTPKKWCSTYFCVPVLVLLIRKFALLYCARFIPINYKPTYKKTDGFLFISFFLVFVLVF
jgi:hypothetical protein